MGAKTKTGFKGFDYMHCDDFAKYLSDMAAKGWHFKEWGVGLKFEKGEPEQVEYAVEIFTGATENDLRPEPHTREFAEYCEAAGWQFVDAKQKFCIFKKVSEHAVELFTPEERVNNVKKGMISGANILLLVLYGINALLQWVMLSTSFERNIFSGTTFFNVTVWNVMFLGHLFNLLYCFLKCRKLKKDIKEGKEIYFGNRIDGRYHLNWKDIYLIILVAILMYYFFIVDRVELVILNAVMITLVFGFSAFINKIRPERDTNIMIQIGFVVVVFLTIIMFTVIIISDNRHGVHYDQGEVPLVITDYRECADEIEDIDFYHERNFLGSMDVYYVFCENNSIYYHLYRSEHGKILDKIWEEEFTGKRYNEEVVDCTVDWGAVKALRNSIGMYYVRYEDVLLVFSDDEDVYLTVEQIEIIRDELDLR